MDLKRIKDLMDLFAASDLAEVNFSEGNCQLRLVRRRSTVEEHADSSSRCGASDSPAGSVTGVAGAPVSAALEGKVGAGDVVAPLHGVLHLTALPDEPPFVRPGDRVREGQTLCLLEAMKMFHTVRSVRDGVVEAILVASGSEVEAGQVLFRIN